MIYGMLLAIRLEDGLPLMLALSARHVEREQAKSIAIMQMDINRGGQRQVLFVHNDNTVELWDAQSL